MHVEDPAPQPYGIMMTNQPRLFAHPEARILCATTRKTVGFLYRWNNGDQQRAWIEDIVRDVSYAPLRESEPDRDTDRAATQDQGDL